MSAYRVLPMLSCEDLPASLAFYGDLLGGVEAFRFPPEGEAVFLTLRLGESEIGLGGVDPSPQHGQPQRPASGHRVELCINVTDLEDTVARAHSAGVEVLTEPEEMPWGERVAWVADPDGNLVMLTRSPSDPRDIH